MFNRLITKSKQRKTSQPTENTSHSSSDLPTVSKDLNENLKAIKDIFDNANDLIIREFKIGTELQVNAIAVMIGGLINEASVNENLIKPLMSLHRDISKESVVKVVKESALFVANIQETQKLDDAVTGILSGDTALFIDGTDSALLASILGWESRRTKN